MSVVAIIFSYVLGSIPTGLWLGLKLRGVDIREHGSKNVGATNTMRVLGKMLGAIALVCDVSKGLIPVLVFSRMSKWEYLPLACGLAAVIGHTASVFLRFRGGKGVATGTGMFLGLYPLPTLVAAAVFFTLFGLTRMVSVGSMGGALALCFALCLTETSWPVRLVATFVAIWVFWKHRSNIQRIVKGEENRITFK